MERTFSLEARAVVPTTDHRDTKRGQQQHEADEQTQRQQIADWRQPGRTDGADQKIRDREDQVRKREGTAKSQLVGNRAAEDGEEPDHAAEDSGERAS